MTAPLFPTAPILSQGYLPAPDGSTFDEHELWFEERGNPMGEPVLYLHGGPGSGCSPDVTQLLDGSHYRIILLDQRGAGQSRPHGSLQNNTTPHLVADCERLRTHLRIDRWMLFGGSWGATLAVAYAMAHPASISRMVMYGLFLARQSELEALYYPHGTAAAMFPDAFQAFMKPLGTAHNADPIAAYAALFQHPDAHVRLDALTRWTQLEKAVSRLILNPEQLEQDMSDPDYVLAHSLIENHYFQHHGFIDADHILATAGQVLLDIPITLIASRYDMVCPITTAYEFARAVPHTRLTIVADAGHTWRDASNTQALLKALAPA